MEEYDKMDEVTYLYIFLGMPALGYEKADAARWLRDTDTMSSKDRQVIGQYIAQKDIKIFIRNIAELKEDLKELLTVYWEKVFRRVWQEIEKSIDKTIDTAAYECRMLGDISQYIANMHKDIKVAKGSIHINKEVPYDIKLSDVKQVHIFPSTFSGEELLIDIFDRSLVIYYNLNLDDSRQEFVSNVSHELKTPLTSMKVLADSLLIQEDAPVELYKEFMGDLSEEIERENKIVNDLLSLVKMDKTANVMNIRSENINELVERILKRLRPIAASRNIEVIFESFRPVTAEVDEVKLSLAISNLVENAIKYNKESGWVHVTLNADHKFFYLEVADSGIGIPQEETEHIFERFYRVDKSHSREIGGTGLGLSIARSAVVMHRGAIKVFSQPGEGTTFTVRIPLIYVT